MNSIPPTHAQAARAAPECVLLPQNEQFITKAAEWLHDEWGHLTPADTLEQRVQRVRQSCGPGLPLLYLAMLQGEAVGTASLVHCDMTTRPELIPWLASVYVSQAYREQGIGSQLVRCICDVARAQGVRCLYLFTPDRMRFYARMGWRVLEQAEYRGEQITIMSYTL